MKHTRSSEESVPYFIFRVVWSAIVGVLFVFPGFTIVYLLNEIRRTYTNYQLSKKYNSKTTVLQEGSDAVWLYKVPNGKRHILYLAINDNQMDIEKHRQNYLDRILSRDEYQKLKQIFAVDFGYNILKYDVNFDIEKHVKYYEGSENRVITEEELMDEVLPLLSEEMDESKPQWEDVIIPQFKYNDEDKVKSARIFRIHHSYMDGGSNLLMIAATQYEGEGEFPFVVNPVAPIKVAWWKKAIFNFNCFLLFAWVFINGLWSPTVRMVRNRFRTPRLTGRTHYGWSKPVPMSLLQKIKSSTGESMPTILMSILGGVIHKFNDKFPSNNPEYADMAEEIKVGMVAGVFPYPDEKLKNRHSIFHMNIDVSDKSAMNRLKSTSATMKAVMWDPHVYLNYVMPSLFGRCPIWFSDACMSVMGFPLVLSNIPVAQKRVKLWGDDVLDIGGWPPMLSICGIGLVTIRYGDSLRVCVNSDNAAISKEELNYIISQVAEEVYKLAESIDDAEVNNVQMLVKSKPLRTFQDEFLQKDEDNTLKFRLHSSINTIKDSISKIRDP